MTTPTTIVPRDRPHLKSLIQHHIHANGPGCSLNHIDVSGTTDFSQLFANTLAFNGDISQWDTSQAIDMSYMFFGCQFNGDISRWDVSSVQNMNGMFGNSAFNGDLSKWDVGRVTDMCSMFSAAKFTGNISAWNVSHVVSMERMFRGCDFNGDVSSWDVSRVTDMSSMFEASQFNGDISTWNVSAVRNMSFMFSQSAFTGDLSQWDVRKVQSFEQMFAATPYAGDLSGWNWDSDADIDGMVDAPQNVPPYLYHWLLATQHGNVQDLLVDHQDFYATHCSPVQALCNGPHEMAQMFNTLWIDHSQNRTLHALALPNLE